MIIKVMPETESEKKRFKTVVHNGVKEFFVMGSKIDGDNDVVEFHDWKGGYRNLIGGLAFFIEKVKNEMYCKEMSEKEKDSTYQLNLGEKDKLLANLLKPNLFKVDSNLKEEQEEPEIANTVTVPTETVEFKLATEEEV